MINENYLTYLYGISTMVSSESESDSGLPDSDNSNNSNLSISNDEIILVGHDNDEELDDHDGIQYHQYEPLPVEESADSTQESSDEEVLGEEDGNVVSAPQNTNISPIVPIENSLIKEVWTGSCPQSVDIEMDSQKIDEVKRAMVNITLPSSSIPEWATKIAEEDWKDVLMEHIERIKRDDGS